MSGISHSYCTIWWLIESKQIWTSLRLLRTKILGKLSVGMRHIFLVTYQRPWKGTGLRRLRFVPNLKRSHHDTEIISRECNYASYPSTHARKLARRRLQQLELEQPPRRLTAWQNFISYTCWTICVRFIPTLTIEL